MSNIVLGMTISLDGYANDRNGSVEHLYSDLGDIGDSELMQGEIRRTGAVLMGRRAYEMAEGDFTGYEFQVPIFVLTHHPPASPAAGENDRLSFTFVTDGLESAVRQATDAAGERDVTVIGGIDVARQLLRADLVDELSIDIMPVLLGGGTRLFDEAPAQRALEKTEVVETGARTGLRFRLPR